MKIQISDSWKQRLQKWEMKILNKIWSVVRDILVLAGNLIAVVVTVVVIFAIARVVSPVDIGLNGNEEEELVIRSGVEAEPLYALAGEEMEGTLNAYQPIDGTLRDGVVLDPYSKEPSNPKWYWDHHNEEAIGSPRYLRYGFMDFNQIVGLQVDDVLVFPQVNFGEESPQYISMQIAKTSDAGGVIAFYIDSISEKNLIAIFDVTEVSVNLGETNFFQVIEPIGRGKEFTGVHKLYLVVEQSGVSLGQIRFGR